MQCILINSEKMHHIMTRPLDRFDERRAPLYVVAPGRWVLADWQLAPPSPSVSSSLLAVVALLEIGSGSAVGPAAWLVLAVPLSAALLHPRVFGPLSSWALRRVRREPLGVLLPFGRVVLMIGWYLVTSALLGFAVWAFMRGIGGPDVGDPVGVASGFLLAFVVSMLVFIVPSGLGVRDAILALVLARQVPGGVAVALSVSSRLFLIAVELVFVALAAAAGRRRGGS